MRRPTITEIAALAILNVHLARRGENPVNLEKFRQHNMEYFWFMNDAHAALEAIGISDGDLK